MKVLYIDDCPISLGTVSSMLGGLGLDLFLSKGIEGTEDIHPDLIILDLYMPDNSGLEICRQFKSNPATKDTPVIFLSSSFDKIDKRACFDAGAIDYLEKPVGREALVNAIKAYASIGVMVRASKHVQQGLIDDEKEKGN